MEDETKKKEPEEQEETKVSKVDEAKQVLEKIEAANKKGEEILEKIETANAEAVVSGQADAGQEQKKKTEDEKITDEANEILEGSGFKV